MKNRTIKMLILDEIESHPSVKSKVLSKIKFMFYRGYMSSEYVNFSKQVNTCFNELIVEKKIKFIPREPLKLL